MSINKGDEAISLLFPSGQIALDPNGKTELSGLRGLLESAATSSSAPADSGVRKMGDLYASCMDMTAIDARGLTPLEPDFDRVAAIRSRADSCRR